MRTYAGGPGSATADFEVILYERINAVQFQYKDIGNLPYGHANGGFATVGLNAGNGIDDTLYTFDSQYLDNGRSILLFPVGDFALTTLYSRNGAVGVNTVTNIFAFFNQPLDIGTIPGAFSLVRTAGSVPVPFVATGTGAGNSILYSLPSPLDVTTNYTASISTALADIYGVHLAAPITWSFTTAP